MSKRGFIFTIAGALLLLGLFVAFRPQAPIEAPATPAAGAARTTPAPKVFDVIVKQGRVASGPAVLKVSEGDEVVLRITSDAADDLHLHGYDLHAHLTPGVAAELRFTADRSGRFDYELHKAHAEIGAIEVYPR